MPVIDFVFFDAGGGHRSAANALKSVIEEQNRSWTVRLVNLQEALDVLDIFRKYLGLRLEDVYNLMLTKGWTLGSAQGLVCDARHHQALPSAASEDAHSTLDADEAGHGRLCSCRTSTDRCSRPFRK